MCAIGGDEGGDPQKQALDEDKLPLLQSVHVYTESRLQEETSTVTADSCNFSKHLNLWLFPFMGIKMHILAR